MDKALTISRVPLDSIHQDPANVRLHDDRNLDSIKTGRNAFLMELDCLYADVIVERIQKLAGVAAVLEGSGETFAARRSAL